MKNWDKWDQTAARLHALEHRARAMCTLAGEMQDILAKMQERPNFETTAQDQLAKLQNEIGVLFAFTKATNEIFSKLPQTA